MKKKNNILTIMKKEFKRIFGDRRMVMSIVLPGLLIYVIYSIMGSTIMSSVSVDESVTYRIKVDNLPLSIHQGLNAVADASDVSLTLYNTIDDPKAAVTDGTLDAYLVFPADFEEAVATYDPAGGLPAPAVEIYYDSSSSQSHMAYSFVVAVLDAYESSMTNRMDINPDPSVSYDLAAPEDLTVMFFSMLMPLLLIMLMFTGCMGMVTESIAGEKERGTIATLLVTPLKRSELAIGKIAAQSVASLLAGLCSFIGILLALPKLMGGEEMGGMLDASVYSIGDYIMLLPVILSTVLLFVSLISVLSAYASSVKEATGMVSPLMLVVTVIGALGMFGGDGALWQSLIPVYNSVRCIGDVFSMNYTPLQILLTTGVNFATAALCVVVLSRMFQSEKVMFKK